MNRKNNSEDDLNKINYKNLGVVTGQGKVNIPWIVQYERNHNRDIRQRCGKRFELINLKL